MRRRSEFKRWFVQQYGRMPANGQKYEALRRDVKAAEHALMIASTRLEVEDALNAAWTAALYGWNARASE